MGKEGDFHLVDAREFKAYGLPLGRLIFSLSRLSRDEETVSGVKQAQALLHEEGLVLLDYHKSIVDIVVTSAVAADNMPIESFKGPVAASYFVKRVYGHLIDRINAIEGVDGMPVIRGKDQKDERVMERISKKFSTGMADIILLNDIYLKEVAKTVKYPYHVAMIAPFGTRDKTGVKNIKWGVAELLRTGCAALCTYTAVKKHPRPFKVLFSPQILRFDQSSSMKDMTEVIQNQFETLKARA